MRRRTGAAEDSGMKSIKALIGIVVVVVAVYVAWNMIPPYFSNYKLQDVIATEARANSYSTKSEDQIREVVVQKAKMVDVALTPEQIMVTRTGQSVSIEVNYTVHLDFPIHPVDLKFHEVSKNNSY
jgi:hypothetical protein